MPGIIERSFWRHPDIRGQSTHSKLLATYLLTGPHHELLGCYYLPLAYVSSDLSWKPSVTESAVKGIKAIGFAVWCPVTDYVLVPKWMRFHPIQNPNQGYARMSQVNSLPKDFSRWELLMESFIRLGGRHLPQGWQESFERFGASDTNPDQQSLKGIANGSGNGSPTIERDRERDKERERETVGAKKPSRYPADFENCWAIYPSRGGAGNSKAAAHRAWMARTKAGTDPEELYQGTVRYRAWCDLEGNTGTKYTKAASTFYGPDEHWTEPYNLDKAGKPIQASRLQSAWDDIESLAE